MICRACTRQDGDPCEGDLATCDVLRESAILAGLPSDFVNNAAACRERGTTMFFYSGNQLLDDAADRALELSRCGKEEEALRLMISVIADIPVSPELLHEKISLINEMRDAAEALS